MDVKKDCYVAIGFKPDNSKGGWDTTVHACNKHDHPYSFEHAFDREDADKHVRRILGQYDKVMLVKVVDEYTSKPKSTLKS